ncbi:MAG: IS1595 family transposase [Solirubrobacteraceae bacterium]
MSKSKKLPTNLLEAVRYFSDLDVATEYVAKLRWPQGPVCPACGCLEYSYLTTRRVWKCKGCKKQYSVKVGTVFEESRLGLDKWLPAVWLAANSKNGISSHELGRSLGVTQKSAWFMLHRIRLAMQSESGIFSGEVEADETFIGGRRHNRHKSLKAGQPKGGSFNKTPVLGFRERGTGRVRAEVVPHVFGMEIRPRVRRTVKGGSTLYTDSSKAYHGMDEFYTHEFVNHAETYVEGRVHTNGIENFWSLLKRGLRGTYVSVEPFHLFRYLDERVFTYNMRDLTDHGRFALVLSGIADRRLTYAGLTGAD